MSFEQHPGFVCRFILRKEMVLKKRKSFIGRKKYRKQLRQLFNEWRKPRVVDRELEKEKKKQLEEMGFETVTYPYGYVEITYGVARGDSRATLRIIS